MTNQNIDTQLVQVHATIDKMIRDKAEAMPRDFNATRFLQNSMTVLQDLKKMDSAKIAKIAPVSIARTILKGAFLGLDFLNKECYAIPYGAELSFQTDYKGEKKLAKIYSINPIRDIYAKLVREGDVFDEQIEAGKQSLSFKPQPFSDAKIIGAFAVVLYEDGSMMYETMTAAEIEYIRKKFSKAQNSKAWVDAWGEMAKKTVLRRVCKHIELRFDTPEQRKQFDASTEPDFNAGAVDATAKVVNPFGEPTDAEKAEILTKERIPGDDDDKPC